MKNNDSKVFVSQKAIIVNKDGNILAIRRSRTAPSRPLHWDLPGGTLDFGEDTQEGITREIREETNLDINNLQAIDVISGMDDRGEFWVTICYIADLTDSTVKLSFEHDDFRWLTPKEFQKLKSSPRNRKFVKRFSSLKSEK